MVLPQERSDWRGRPYAFVSRELCERQDTSRIMSVHADW